MTHLRLHSADSSDRPRPSRHRRRAGHTLIEILLALGLSLVILAAAYAALEQHWRFADAGQRQTERMQVTRALFERMSLDLRSVVFRPDAGPDLAMGTGNNTRIDVIQPDELYVGRSVGIVGDGRKLVLQIDAPSGERSVGPQSVLWEMRSVDSNLSDEDYAAKSRAVATPAAEASLGLARIVRDAASLEAASWEAAQTVSPKDMLAAEVETIRFRYFARGSWFHDWHSVDRQELPQAVEITIGFRHVIPAEQAANGQTHPGEYRLIVPVPVSEA